MAEVEVWEEAFAEAARKDGIELEPQTFTWASEPGHLAVSYLANESDDPGVMQRAEVGAPALNEMFRRMKGLDPVLQSCRLTKPYPAVLVHMETATLVELDNMLHFSSPRLLTLELYPGEVKIGFDIKEYKELCREYAPKTDRWRYGLASKCFGFHGMQNERAYYDAVRDIASWVMGFPPLFRVPAIDEDGAATYERSKDKLAKRLGR